MNHLNIKKTIATVENLLSGVISSNKMVSKPMVSFSRDTDSPTANLMFSILWGVKVNEIYVILGKMIIPIFGIEEEMTFIYKYFIVSFENKYNGLPYYNYGDILLEKKAVDKQS